MDNATQTTETKTPVTEPTPEEQFAQDVSGEAEPATHATPDKPAEVKTEAKPTYNRDEIERRKNLARLSKEKRDMEKKLEAMRAEQEALASAKAKLADPSVPYAEKVRILKGTVGVDPDALAESFIKTGEATDNKPIPEVQRIEAELRALREDQQRKAADEAKRAAMHQRQQDIERANGYLAKNDEQYPLLNALGKGAVLVAELDRLEQSGEIEGMTLDEVAADLEAKAEAEIEKELTILLGKEKFKAMLAKLTTETKPKIPKARATLTNKMATAPKDEFDYSKATPAEIERYALEGFNLKD